MFEAEATARRASLPTVPESEARKQVSSSAGDCMLDQPKLTWAVDLGEKVLAMSTFDLWYALSAGDIANDAKVWRVGREAWTTAMEVPELACALADIEELIPSRQTLDYVAQPPSFGAEQLERAVSHVATPDAELAPSDRDSHEQVFEHELEEAIETPHSELSEAYMRSEEMTPSADLPMGQVISLHPSSQVELMATSTAFARKRRAIAALSAVAATLAAGFSLLFALAAPNVGAEEIALANAALLPGEVRAPVLAASPLFDMEADALAEASAQRVAERLSSELVSTQAEIVTHVKKSWSPSEKGQKRMRATGKPAAKKSVKSAPKLAPGRSTRSTQGRQVQGRR